MDRVSFQGVPLVAVKDVSKSYGQAGVTVHALKHVDLVVAQGEFSALVGPSGSGKTTLLNLIGALDRPSSGSITLGDVEVSADSSARLAQVRLHRIGFVFQDYNLLPVLSAIENVEYVLLLQGVPAAERRRRADEALVKLGLDGCQHRRPSQLSGGQQQRVAIARALAADPMLILADEPTANLDSDTGAALIESMLALNREHGTTFLFSTHDEMVMRHATRVIRMKDGCIQEGVAHAVS
jgi:putative ABC transport system ATP-binding protein